MRVEADLGQVVESTNKTLIEYNPITLGVATGMIISALVEPQNYYSNYLLLGGIIMGLTTLKIDVKTFVNKKLTEILS